MPESIEILKIHHSIILDRISPETGKIRTEVSAIFNEAGVAIYITPPPQSLNKLLNIWCQCCETNDEPGPIKAILVHFWFEKIHPFLDGNGRVGRLIISYILKQSGYDFGELIAFEEYLDEHRQEYYDGLSLQATDVTEFVEFMLEGLTNQVVLLFDKIRHPPAQLQSNLLPRRQKILDTISDHRFVSFDMIWRRFRKIPKSSLHNDLKQLMKAGLIKKLGTTRGVEYSLSDIK